MIKICEFCNSEFEVKTKKQFKNKKCCTQSCSAKLQWVNHRETMISAGRSQSAREKKSDAGKKAWINLETRTKLILNIIKHANSDKAKEQFQKRIDKWRKENYSDYLKMRKEVANRSSVKHIASETHKKLWANLEYRENQIKKFSKGQLKRWSQPEAAEHAFKLMHRYKDYELPSGKIVKVQGYEPFALDELLKKYKESDLVIGVKNINCEIGQIKYTQDNKIHTYYPDCFIKSINTIIEVKSQWTYDKWKEKNELKKQACLNAGFNFKFMFF